MGLAIFPCTAMAYLLVMRATGPIRDPNDPDLDNFNVVSGYENETPAGLLRRFGKPLCISAVILLLVGGALELLS
jgi:hypothetical protein